MLDSIGNVLLQFLVFVLIPAAVIAGVVLLFGRRAKQPPVNVRTCPKCFGDPNWVWYTSQALRSMPWTRLRSVTRADCSLALADRNGPVGTLRVSFVGERDESGHPIYHWSVSDPEGDALEQGTLVVENRRPDARTGMARLIAQLIQTADEMSGFLDGNNYAFAAPFFEQPDVRSFALLHIEQLQEAIRQPGYRPDLLDMCSYCFLDHQQRETVRRSNKGISA